MVLATELVDWRRFASPRQLAAYLGFVPREDSTGDRERKGAITKAGNAHCRHALIQAAWSYRYVPQVAVVAVARELIGFLWAAMQDLESTSASPAPLRPA
jgi:transposase